MAMFRNKLIALINWLEAKHWTLAIGLKAPVVYRVFFSSLLYCLYLAATRNHTASYVVSRPLPKSLNSPKFKWKRYSRIILFLLAVYLMTETLSFWSLLNSPFENTTGKTIIGLCWDIVWQWVSADAFSFKETMKVGGTAAGAAVGFYLLNRRTKASDKQVRLAEDGLDIDRFRKGSEMLAHEHPSVRQAGIVSLKSLALSRPKEYGSLILDVFTKFLKKPDADFDATSNDVYTLIGRPDIHLAFATAMEVWQHKLIRKRYLQEHKFLDMDNIRLHGGSYSASDFQFVSLEGAEFDRCDFFNIKFHFARFLSSNFKDCNFNGSSFVGAYFLASTFEDCNFFNVNWNGAIISRVGIYNGDPYFSLDEDYEVGWLNRSPSDFEKIWFCFDVESVTFQTKGAKIFGYSAIEEKCGSLKRIKFVKDVPCKE